MFPSVLGWKVDGFNVAPATSDVLITERGVSAFMLKILRTNKYWSGRKLNIPALGKSESDFLYEMFSAGYVPDNVKLKDGFTDFIRQMDELLNVFIVTNSDPKKVSKIITDQSPEVLDFIHVQGFAEKYRVNPNSYIQDKHMQLNGFRRKVILGRDKYRDALLTVNRFGPIIMGVGDIFELDLAMLLYLSESEAFGHIDLFLMENKYTLPEEAKLFKSETKNGLFLIHDLEEIPKILKERLSSS